jgi:hypothetical protein
MPESGGSVSDRHITFKLTFPTGDLAQSDRSSHRATVLWSARSTTTPTSGGRALQFASNVRLLTLSGLDSGRGIRNRIDVSVSFFHSSVIIRVGVWANLFCFAFNCIFFL